MKFISGSAFFHPAFKLTVVAIVSGLPDSQIVDAAFRKMFDPENKELVKLILILQCFYILEPNRLSTLLILKELCLNFASILLIFQYVLSIKH